MRKKGLILCVCQGTCINFSKMDVFSVLSNVLREKLFDYSCMHPRLCVGGGEEFLKVLLSGGETEKLYIAACYPQMQCILFRDAFDTVGFDRTKHIALDIRYKTTEEALEEIKKHVNTNPERDSRERVAQGSSPRELNQGKASYLCTEDSQPQRQNLASY